MLPQSCNSPRGGTDMRLPLIDVNGHVKTIAQVEQEVISVALVRYAGSVSHAAKALGIGRGTLYRKIRRQART